ncbi:DUF1192 domain-containing protein [Bosea sp. 117]|uniref:DUF1192 domain-containing protein n=1 Tax=Bosea sp. 117 TaxID=1125973 RepID=UPI0004945CAC|nr:DUF1192 domain-containing protein [Bosea sp. 117]
MAMEDDPLRPPRAALEIGGDLSTLSETEIEERIAALEAEIARLSAALGSKRASRAAADAFFKK